MSPQFQFNPSAVSATIEVLPPGDYEFKVGAPKAFLNKDDKGEDKNYGIRFSLVSDDNKRQVQTCYLHNEGSLSFTKQFLMACLGFGKNKTDEKRFDEAYGDHDWAVDWSSLEVGEAWQALEGQRVTANLDVRPNPQNKDEMQQQFKGFRPVGS